MRTIRAASLTLLAIAAFAGEAEPWLTVSVPDGAKTAERFNASIYGKVVNSAEFAPLKARIAAAIAAETAQEQQARQDAGDEFALLLKEAGLTPFDLFTRLRFLDLAIQGEEKGKDGKGLVPGLRLAFDLGDQFAQVAAKGLAKDVDKGKTKTITVPGTDGAWVDASGKNDPVLRTLRFGSQFVLTNSERAAWQQRVAPKPADCDLVMRLLPSACVRSIERLVPAEDRVQMDRMLERLRRMAGSMDMTADFVPAGVHMRTVVPEAYACMTPVDKAVLAKLPATTMSAVAGGLDGAAWWATERADLFKALGAAQTPPIGADQVEKNLDAALKGQGLTCTAAELVSGIKGTAVFALMQAAPFPTAALAIPRSKGLDEVVALVLKQAQQEMPAEGAMAMIPLGAIPMSLTLVRAPGHWLMTTDTMLASTWAGTAPGGWLDTPTGKLAVEKAGADAWMVGAADNAAEIRMYTGFLAMGLQNIPGLTPEERQAVMKTMQVLAQNAQPGWCVGRNKGATAELELTGLTGGIAIPAIIAAIAIPNLLESRKTANESAAVATLKSGVLPAQIQFQAGGYMDQDRDGTGEYGFFQELAGGPIAGQGADLKVNLMTADFNTPEPEKNGYRYAIFLPDGQGGATAERLGVRKPDAKAADAQEKRFVVYAWPVEGGGRMFAITQAGQVHASPVPSEGEAPACSAARARAGMMRQHGRSTGARAFRR